MKTCQICSTPNPDPARYCMSCGSRLEEENDQPQSSGLRFSPGGSQVFLLTLVGSLLLSFVLIAVFNLPIFVLGAFLPLLWTRRKSR